MSDNQKHSMTLSSDDVLKRLLDLYPHVVTQEQLANLETILRQDFERLETRLKDSIDRLDNCHSSQLSEAKSEIKELLVHMKSDSLEIKRDLISNLEKNEIALAKVQDSLSSKAEQIISQISDLATESRTYTDNKIKNLEASYQQQFKDLAFKSDRIFWFMFVVIVGGALKMFFHF